ncbi:hypothetical protein [Roseofilum sp. Guam]|uniref:hypothetical protein n=1 Tax=Roseofilum sp. Guam TaxID=2821502 RepID=UPI001B21F4EA|nr:hypothetical protein [Roseofilum sp. Guam]MBP0028522.1 hypothetical protein [Roseofilum sp. Guam]
METPPPKPRDGEIADFGVVGALGVDSDTGFLPWFSTLSQVFVGNPVSWHIRDRRLRNRVSCTFVRSTIVNSIKVETLAFIYNVGICRGVHVAKRNGRSPLQLCLTVNRIDYISPFKPTSDHSRL